MRLGEEFTPTQADRTKPDAIVVATGGAPDTLTIPGIDGGNVLSGAELRERAKLALKLLGPKSLGRVTKMWLPVGKRVVIIGGGIQGCETAEFLVKRGRKVTIAEAGDQVGMEIPLLQRILLLPWLAKKGATILTEVTTRRSRTRASWCSTRKDARSLLEADTVVVTIPLKPESRALRRRCREARRRSTRSGTASEPGLDHRRDRWRASPWAAPSSKATVCMIEDVLDPADLGRHNATSRRFCCG